MPITPKSKTATIIKICVGSIVGVALIIGFIFGFRFYYLFRKEKEKSELTASVLSDFG